MSPVGKRRHLPVQVTFADRPTRAGKRRKAPGRKAAPNAKIRHRVRPIHRSYHPLHITLRAMAGIPSFRQQSLYAAFESTFRNTRRSDFRIIEYSVQGNHVHLIVEATDKRALSSGMKSFTVRANCRVNAKLGRRSGRIWSDRYHRRDLTSPRQVRNALVYCLSNYKKHTQTKTRGLRIDSASSARWFLGWSIPRTRSDGPRPTEEAQTFLLRIAWQRHGLVHPSETPRS